jgi:membrane protein DedA with SNARE-associated domain
VTDFAALGALAVATLVSEDLACIGAGAAVAAGELGFVPAAAACGAGIFAGDMALFAAGRTLRSPLRRWVDGDALARASDWLERNGPSVVVLSRFAPGTRLPTYVAAGALRTRTVTFALWFGLACALWTPALVGASALWSNAVRESLGNHPGLLAAAALALVATLRLANALATHRGRRLLLSRWRRLTRWEFWPLWLFYVPIALWIAWLALRHRSVLLATAVNPGIPGGGFAGERKSGILRGFRGADEFLLASELLSADEMPARRAAQARAFAERAGLPIVLKPDVGERGSGVRFAHDMDELERMAREVTTDVVLQEFAPGIELGIFWVRHPGEAHGRIVSLTEKQLIAVTGDGERTLERLILDHPRAVCMAPTFLARFASWLDEVPWSGRTVRLVDVGTHSQGALFLDARRHLTPALEASIDRLGRSLPGFHFGRFDVRVPSFEDLRAGRGIRVLELNGLSAEATHIYDPANSLREAYRVLFAQWSLAFEIAAANRARGAVPASFAEIRALLAHRRAVRRGVTATPGTRPSPEARGVTDP